MNNRLSRFLVLSALLGLGAVIAACADRVWLYSPGFEYSYGAPVAQAEWTAQPFHVPFEATADLFGVKVGVGQDPDGAGMFVSLREDSVDPGTGASIPGAVIAEWDSLHPQDATARWLDLLAASPITLYAGTRYWIVVGSHGANYLGQIAISGGDMWALKSFDQAASWQDWGFRAAVRVGGYPVPEPSGAVAFLGAAPVFVVLRRRFRAGRG